jgi:RIO kinase 1
VSAELEVLIAEGVIDEILGRLKSGKEADLSLVRRGDDVIAAKVYKDRATRSFKNNADYKEGRKVRNSRTQRAIESGGRFGRDAAEQAWKSAEADALYKLAGSGVRVPEPLMFYEGVLLMELVRDAEGRPAPRLIDVAIERDAALGIYADLVAQIISMLCCDLIHGDLSPYNILAGADGPTIIDFPQVISAVHSSRAEFFFLRDFDNVVRFLAGFDPRLAVHTADGRAIWRAYVSRELTPQFVPPPPPPPRQDRRGDGRPPRGGQRDGRWSPPRNGRPMPPRDDRGPYPSRDGRDGRTQTANQQPRRSDAPRNGPPMPPRDDRGPHPFRDGRDGRTQSPSTSNQQRRPDPPRNGPPRDDRGPNPFRDGRDGRTQSSPTSNQQPGNGPPRDDRGGQRFRDGRPPPSPSTSNQSPRSDRSQAAPRSAQPPRPPPRRSPPPPVAVRWTADGPANVARGRRRPKRRG